MRTTLRTAADEAGGFIAAARAGTIGSRTLVGALGERDLATMRDAEGQTALDARRAYLGALSDLPRLAKPPLERLTAHVEVHIEQRHELVRRGALVGVVERIAAPSRQEAVIRGRSGHAGELPMEERRDALCAAAELILALESAAREAGRETVATAGRLVVEPGVVTAVPGEVRMELEVRSTDPRRVAAVEGAFAEACDRVEAERGVTVRRRSLRAGAPTRLDPELTATALALAEQRGAHAERTFSGAGHDVQHIAASAPAALLLVPLTEGESHTPLERAEPQSMALATGIVTGILQSRPPHRSAGSANM